MLLSAFEIFEAYTDIAIDMPLEKRLEDLNDLENYIDNVWPNSGVSKESLKLLRIALLDYVKNPPIDSNDLYHRFEKPLSEVSL